MQLRTLGVTLVTLKIVCFRSVRVWPEGELDINLLKVRLKTRQRWYLTHVSPTLILDLSFFFTCLKSAEINRMTQT